MQAAFEVLRQSPTVSGKERVNLTIALLILAWAAVVALGLRTLFAYETTAGPVGKTPATWPVGSKIRLAENADTLLMFVHPHCPCTAASLEEFAQIMAQVRGRVKSYVLLCHPRSLGTEWTRTAIAESAAKIPDVAVLSDPDGEEATQFGAKTSGYVLLFDSQGRRLFRGGITAMRGHAGENLGERAVISLVRRETNTPQASQVFGCSLFGETR